ncbi:hypothetical protein CHS0354_021491 [Potamilus streckersoni]|uniref:Uncharacterized protein n=1 Tax=Potamilus streckersoni TaxID=2493646 RepID=A0AAE0S1U6_9BIVA|nr:hypothetical protein CHS0354_021491 [Potamilus streckersoni]
MKTHLHDRKIVSVQFDTPKTQVIISNRSPIPETVSQKVKLISCNRRIKRRGHTTSNSIATSTTQYLQEKNERLETNRNSTVQMTARENMTSNSRMQIVILEAVMNHTVRTTNSTFPFFRATVIQLILEEIIRRETNP